MVSAEPDQLKAQCDEATGMDSLYIDKELYPGQRPTAVETGAPVVINIIVHYSRVSVPLV